MSRDDYHRSANSISDSERGVELQVSEGYSSRRPPTTPPDVELVGAGDDPYGGYDPGMAGCTIEQNTCHIAGVPWMGTALPGPAHTRPHPHARTESRGYERDEDEYAGSFASGTPAIGSPSGPAAPLPDTGASTKTSPVPAPAPGQPATDPAVKPGGPHSPSIGTRLVGRVERFAGKVFRDSSMEARGKRHMTGHL